MARTIKEAWNDYKRHYHSGFEVNAKKDIPVYDGETSKNKVATIAKGTPVHVKPLKGNDYVARIEVIYNTDKHGWISTPMLGKPGATATGKKKKSCPLKPQDFDGIAGVKLGFSAYYKKVKEAIMKRNDLPMVLKTYLIELTDYCMHHGPAEKKELVDAYNELTQSEYIDCMNDIEKDFSEITAPLCVLERGSNELEKLGFPDLNKNNASVYIPVEGNYALVDFMLYDDQDRQYQFSVKKISKTTNVVKPQDILDLLNKSPNAKWVKAYKKTFPYKLLTVLAENSVKKGSFLALKLCAENPDTRKELPAKVVQGIDKMVKDGEPDETDVELAHPLWWELAGEYYNDAIDYWSEPKHSSGIVGIASLICQMMLRKLSAEKKLITFRDVIEEFVMREVVYYKFAAPNGIPQFYMENHLKNNLKPTDNYYLREKSSIGNPYRDKVGVQP